MSKVGRPRSCECGQCRKCKQREYMREWYRRKSPEERRAILAKRDKKKARQSDRRRYARDPERRRAQNEAWRERNAKKAKAIQVENSRRWRGENPEAYRAHVAVNNAVRDGRLLKRPCEACESSKAEAHHEDYSKPFDVKWLCRQCHALLHKERRALPF